ncbi:MAG: alpha/beta hydrolase [Burkholderiaceae bacterium]
MPGTDVRSTLVIVPGLRDHVAQHWQTLLAASQPGSVTVPPMGRDKLQCQDRVGALEKAVAAAQGPVLLVAHSGGCITVAHWAGRTALASRVRGALLATPPDFDRPMPAGYPSTDALHAAGWFPVPRQRLPFPSLVAVSQNDPLGQVDRVRDLARSWGSRTVDLGDVGHLNPASGFGPWPGALALISELDRCTGPAAPA